jgi:integrase
VLDAVPEPQRLLIRFLAETGLRISEAVALRWSDVDLDGARIVVRGRYSQGTVDAPKSLASRRQVPLSAEMALRWPIAEPRRSTRVRCSRQVTARRSIPRTS